MTHTIQKSKNLALRKARVRSVVHGTADRPRLTVTISNTHVSAQIIDDDAQKTLVAATTVGTTQKGTMTDKAVYIGTTIGKAAKKAKITKLAFDRNGKQSHGRIKALADAVRAEGLEF